MFTGEFHTIALCTEGSLWTWGSNGSGRLGDGTTTPRNTPTRLETETAWVLVSGGWAHTVAVGSDGTLWTWGHNFSGQLGDGTRDNRHTPLRITPEDVVEEAVVAGSEIGMEVLTGDYCL